MWTLDDLDVGIIKAIASPRSFQWNVRISNANIANGLAVDNETVRKRLKNMNVAGFLQGWQLVLNPILLGRNAAIVELHGKNPESKSHAISQICLLDGVMLIEDFYGNNLAIHILYENEDMLTRQVALISSLCDCPTPVWWKLGYPPCELVPTITDWRIIQSLRMDARKKLSCVASELDLSTRTVKRHMNKLIKENALYLDPVLDVSKVGGVRSRFWITSNTDKKRAVDMQIFENMERIISTHTMPEKHSLFIVQCSNASEVQDISHWLEKLDGVKEVRANIEIDHIHINEWLVDEIQKRTSESTA